MHGDANDAMDAPETVEYICPGNACQIRPELNGERLYMFRIHRYARYFFDDK